MGILGQAVAEPQAWYTEGWVLWLLAAACIVGPSVVAYLISGGLRAKDMWGRMAVVLTALTCGIVIVASGWPPRLGIDLKGGVILVYEVDAAKRVSEQADDAARRIEDVINREEGLEGRRISNGRGPGCRAAGDGRCLGGRAVYCGGGCRRLW